MGREQERKLNPAIAGADFTDPDLDFSGNISGVDIYVDENGQVFTG